MRRRKSYPGRARVDQKFEKKNLKVPKTVAQCRHYPIPYLYTLSRTIPYLYTLNRTMPYLYTLNRTIPYLNTLNRTIPYLNTLSRTITYLNTLSRPIPYVNTLSRTVPYVNALNRTIPYLKTLSLIISYVNRFSRTIPYLITLSRTIPYLNTLRKNPNLAQNQILVGSQSESSTKKTLKPRQPIRIEYHSAETYPILIHCRNRSYLNTSVGDPSRSWARVGRYSLS